ncbi:thiol:disulfide interchange protein DsbA/DsbL [Marinobacteraceae bacterium S3BR75-40.1]
MPQKFIAVLLALVLPLLAIADDGPWEEGTHYTKLPTPVGTDHPDKIEVAEVFWYGCPHCYNFKPKVEEWAKDLPDDVEFVLWPAALNPSWQNHARAFFVAKVLGVLDKVHDPLFNALGRDHRRDLSSQEELADFFAKHGVDRERFNQAWNSFGVNTLYEKIQSRIRGAFVTGTPSMIVNGKYRVSAGQAGGHDEMLKIVDYLIEKERQAKAG